MSWTERDLRTGEQMHVTAEKAAKLDAGKAVDLPKIAKEEMKSFEPIKFQPVKSPGIYDAEFGVKGPDLIFHFWPAGYHEAERRGTKAPAFVREFPTQLGSVMTEIFKAERCEFYNDPDVGAYTVKAMGWGENQFVFDLAVKACKNLHLSMGGALT